MAFLCDISLKYNNSKLLKTQNKKYRQIGCF
jgi:hypothetical protein